MNYPCLVLKKDCTTPVVVTLYEEGVSRTGGPLICLDKAELRGNYQDRAKTIFTKEKKEVTMTGSLYFRGDICPESPVISGGEVEIFGVKRQIVLGMKARNPDGTVNYTKLELM